MTNFFFIFIISNLHLVWFFSWLTWLELYQFYWSFQKTKFLVLLIFLCCFPVFNLIDFHSNFYHFFSYVCFSLYFSSFSSFLTWKPRLYIVDLSSFLCAFSTVNFTPLLLLHFTNSDNLSFQCDLLENIPVSPETSLTYLAIRSVLFNLLIFWHFVAIFLLLISSLILWWLEKIFCMTSLKINFLRHAWWLRIWTILVSAPGEQEKHTYFAILRICFH